MFRSKLAKLFKRMRALYRLNKGMEAQIESLSNRLHSVESQLVDACKRLADAEFRLNCLTPALQPFTPWTPIGPLPEFQPISPPQPWPPLIPVWPAYPTLPDTVPMVPTVPTWPTYPTLTKCSVCGIDQSGAMLYVCGNYNCPGKVTVTCGTYTVGDAPATSTGTTQPEPMGVTVTFNGKYA